MFWEIGLTQDGKTILSNPQLANSYSYAGDNPVNGKDPEGRIAQVLLGAGAGIVGQYGYDVYNNIQTNGFSSSVFTSNLSSGKTYLTRVMQGAVVSITGGLAEGFFGLGAVGQSVSIGVTSGAVGVLGNIYLGQQNTPQSIVADTAISALTFGAIKSTQAVSGRLPNFGTKAFLAGKHTQQSATSLGVNSIASYTSSLLGSISLGGNSESKSNISSRLGDQNINSSALLKNKQ